MRRSSSASLVDDLTDYVTGVFYFDGPVESPASILARLLPHFSVVLPKGRAKVFATRCDAEQERPAPRAPWGGRAKPLADRQLLEWLESLPRSCSTTCLVRRASAAAETFDHLLTLTVQQAEPPNDRTRFIGARSDATLSFTLAADILRRHSDSEASAGVRIADWFRELVRLIGAGGPCSYGFVHTLGSRETSAGTLHNSLRIGGVPWSELISDLVWWERREKRIECIRGVFWGNYLGPSLCAKGAAEPSLIEAVKRLLAQPKWDSLYHPVFDQHPNGGLFFSLCDSPTRFASSTTGGLYAMNSPVGPLAAAIWIHASDRGLTM